MQVGEHAHPAVRHVEGIGSPTPRIPAICSVNASRVAHQVVGLPLCDMFTSDLDEHPPLSDQREVRTTPATRERSSAASARRCGYVRTGWAWRGWPAEPPGTQCRNVRGHVTISCSRRLIGVVQGDQRGAQQVLAGTGQYN